MSNEKKLTKRRIKKKNNDCFWMENIFCLESHIHLCSRHTSAIPAYVIKTCVTWHAISGTRYWGFVSPKLHVSTYRNQQHCWWFHKFVLCQSTTAHDCFPVLFSPAICAIYVPSIIAPYCGMFVIPRALLSRYLCVDVCVCLCSSRCVGVRVNAVMYFTCH